MRTQGTAGTAAGGRSHESKYARKRRLLESGERDPFQFKEHKEEDLPPDQPAIAAPGNRQVRGTVTELYLHRGFLFLKTSSGEPVYLGWRTLQKVHPGEIHPGFLVDCEIGPHPSDPNKYPRVTRVFSVIPK